MYFCCLAFKKHYQSGSVLNSDLWCSAICDSGHFESVLNDLIPFSMTGTSVNGYNLSVNIIEGGDIVYYATASSHHTDNQYVYTLFDKISNNGERIGDSNFTTNLFFDSKNVKSSTSIIIEFPSKIECYKVKIDSAYWYNAGVVSPENIKIYGSVDNVSWDELCSFSGNYRNTWDSKTIKTNIRNPYKYLKIDMDAQWHMGLSEIYLYGRNVV